MFHRVIVCKADVSKDFRHGGLAPMHMYLDGCEAPWLIPLVREIDRE